MNTVYFQEYAFGRMYQEFCFFFYFQALVLRICHMLSAQMQRADNAHLVKTHGLSGTSVSTRERHLQAYLGNKGTHSTGVSS